jgi:transcriptional regulator GlxA family with amidase domain
MYFGVVQMRSGQPSTAAATSASGSRRIVVLAVPPVEELDIVGPWEVFTTANSALRGRRRGYIVELVTTSRQRLLTGDSGLSLLATRRYNQLRGEVDTLIVPGGTGPQAMRDPEVLKWLRNTARKARRVVSICTGAFVLAEAGILDGRTATTHWRYANDFAQRYPQVSVEPDRIYVQDGRVYTSAGVTAGMDLSRALVEEDVGSAIALETARALVLFLRRPGGQAQFSTLLSSQASECRPLRELQAWIAENVKADLSVEALASRVAMSPRNFARVFAKELGTTPAHFVENVRIEFARRELETTDRSLEEIASFSGFTSAEVMRRAFLRGLGTSPGAYREHFRSRREVF